MFVDNKGYPVKIISDPEHLRGRPKGITVYMRYNSWENKNWEMFCELESMGRINIETPDYGPTKLKWLEERDKV